jgi:adenosine deaminase
MISEFQIALEADDLDGIRRAPKADLHTHGYLGADRAYVCAKTGRDIEPVHAPLASMDAMHMWVGDSIGDLFVGPEGWRLGLEAVFARALKDGLSRIEFGPDVWMITQNLGSAAELFDSIEAVRASMAPEVEWSPQLGLSRHCKLSWLQDWIAPFLEVSGWYSLDLSGDELAQPVETFAPIYKTAKARGLRLKAHVGEWGTADDVWRAVETLELDEVQHGIAAAASPKVMRFLADNGIRLNVCPTSNVMLGRVESLRDHPIRKLFDAGVKVTVNTDDALVFGVGVSDEFRSLFQAGLFTAAELDTIRQGGLKD